MVKYKISLTKLALRSCYNFNLSFWANASRSNQYFSRQSQASKTDEVTLNKLLKAVTSLV